MLEIRWRRRILYHKPIATVATSSNSNSRRVSRKEYNGGVGNNNITHQTFLMIDSHTSHKIFGKIFELYLTE